MGPDPMGGGGGGIGPLMQALLSKLNEVVGTPEPSVLPIPGAVDVRAQDAGMAPPGGGMAPPPMPGAGGMPGAPGPLESAMMQQFEAGGDPSLATGGVGGMGPRAWGGMMPSARDVYGR